MKALIDRLLDSLHIAWTIAAKDIADALKNRTTLANILIIVGMVVFFFWASTLRPFDKTIEVVLYNEGDSELQLSSAELSDGYRFDFEGAGSLDEMKSLMRYEHIGVVVPAEFEGSMAAGETPTGSSRARSSRHRRCGPGCRSGRASVPCRQGRPRSRPIGGRR